MATHSVERPHICSVCAVGFTRKDKLTRHMKIHTRANRGTDQLTCRACRRDFPSFKQLRSHVCAYRSHDNREHESQSHEYPADTADPNQGNGTQSHDDTDQSHDGPNLTIDTPDPPPDRSRSEINDAIIAKLTDADLLAPYTCVMCGSTFKSRDKLKRHMLVHLPDKNFKCTLCSSAFKRKDKLKRHMTIHDPIKRFPCPYHDVSGCTKAFNRSDKLKAHMSSHDRDVPVRLSAPRPASSVAVTTASLPVYPENSVATATASLPVYPTNSVAVATAPLPVYPSNTVAMTTASLPVYPTSVPNRNAVSVASDILSQSRNGFVATGDAVPTNSVAMTTMSTNSLPTYSTKNVPHNSSYVYNSTDHIPMATDTSHLFARSIAAAAPDSYPRSSVAVANDSATVKQEVSLYSNPLACFSLPNVPTAYVGLPNMAPRQGLPAIPVYLHPNVAMAAGSLQTHIQHDLAS